MLGVAVTGLLASFMAGMAANVCGFNTVFTYDIWQAYIRKDRDDDYYLRVGRVVDRGRRRASASAPRSSRPGSATS